MQNRKNSKKNVKENGEVKISCFHSLSNSENVKILKMLKKVIFLFTNEFYPSIFQAGCIFSSNKDDFIKIYGQPASTTQKLDITTFFSIR